MNDLDLTALDAHLQSERMGAILRDRWGLRSSPVAGSLPPSSSPGQIAHYRAGDDGLWSFVYDPEGGAQYPWAFTGGTDLVSEVVNSVSTDTTTSSTFSDTDITTTVALEGEYVADFGAKMGTNSTTAANYIQLTVAGSDLGELLWLPGSAHFDTESMRLPFTAAAGATVKLMFRTTAGTFTLFDRWLRITPRRVSA